MRWSPWQHGAARAGHLTLRYLDTRCRSADRAHGLCSCGTGDLLWDTGCEGRYFFQGLIRRPADQLDAQVTFRGQLDGNRMESLEETIEVNVTLRNSVGWQLLGEQWRFSPILRQ